MADIRIKDLPTTASDFSSDDFIAIDGTANGTRKINAKTANLTFSDVTLGTSGPSVKSSLGARAARQGLVLNGTLGGTVAFPAPGIGDYTYAFWINPTNFSVTRFILGANTGPAVAIFVNTSGRIGINDLSTGNLTGTTSLTAAKWQFVTLRRSGTSLYIGINGIEESAITDNRNYTTATAVWGASSGNGVNDPWLGGLSGPYAYNRALSATEVVSLYESGVPSGGDYNTASNTALNTNTVTDAGSGSLSGASATGFTATATGAYYVRTSPVFSVIKGAKYKISFTASSITGTWNTYISLFNTAIDSSQYPVVSGANGFEIVANITRTTNEVIEFASSGAGAITVSGLSVTRIGLLLAPDAAQAGGGLAWYDTSGNAANITLPASGVTWNVPTSGYVTSGSLLNLAAGGTNQNITLTPSGTGELISAGTNSRLLFVNSGGPSIGYSSTFDGLQLRTASTVRYSITNAGRHLFGTGVDSGALLQIGTNTTTSSGGVILGTDCPFYRIAAGVVRGDFDFRINGNLNLSTNTINALGGSLVLASNNTTALTLDSSQNATFANGLTVGKANSVNAITGGDGGAGTSIVQFKNSSGVTKMNFTGDGNAVFSGNGSFTAAVTAQTADINGTNSASSYPLTIKNNALKGSAGQYVGLLIKTNDASPVGLSLMYFGATALADRYLRLAAYDEGGGGWAKTNLPGKLIVDDTTLSGGAGSGALQVAGGIYSGAASVFGDSIGIGGAPYYSAKLTVDGSVIVAGGLGIAGTRGGPTTNIYNDGGTTSTSKAFRVVNSGGGVLATFEYGGNVGIGTQTPTQKLDVNGAATFAGTVQSSVSTGSRTIQSTPTVTVAPDAVQNLVSQNYGFFLVNENLLTGSIAIIGFNSGGTYIVWQEGTNYSATANTASKFNVYYSAGTQLVVQNKKTSNATFNIINLAGGS